ncbi:MAG: phosphatidate cytidylyltransferase, partial [Methyloligellaceae bacterium]
MIGQQIHSCDGRNVRKAKQSEIFLRVLSAIVLAAVALLATYAGAWPFTVLVAAAALVLAWEWGGMTCRSRKDSCFLVLAGVAVAAAFLMSAGLPVFAVALIAAAAVSAALLAARSGELIWVSVGALIIGLPAIALIWIRQSPDYGWLSICFIFAVVWTPDS